MRIIILAMMFLFGCMPSPRTVSLIKDDDDDVIPNNSDKPIWVIGDIHGDYQAAVNAVKLTGCMNDQFQWTCGESILVQTGDLIDRGDDDRKIIEMFLKLRDTAKLAGGKVFLLLGNHETMNAYWDFRYTTEASDLSFAEFDPNDPAIEWPEEFPASQRGRAIAFTPGGPFARKLAQNDVVKIVGESVFVHGGVEGPYSTRDKVAEVNREVKRWLKNERAMPDFVREDIGPLWSRTFSDREILVDCDNLQAVLNRLDVKRMVVGHTPYLRGISHRCQGKVIYVDVGMSAHYGGTVEVLKIQGDQLSKRTHR